MITPGQVKAAAIALFEGDEETAEDLAVAQQLTEGELGLAVEMVGILHGQMAKRGGPSAGRPVAQAMLAAVRSYRLLETTPPPGVESTTTEADMDADEFRANVIAGGITVALGNAFAKAQAAARSVFDGLSDDGVEAMRHRVAEAAARAHAAGAVPSDTPIPVAGVTASLGAFCECGESLPWGYAIDADRPQHVVTHLCSCGRHWHFDSPTKADCLARNVSREQFSGACANTAQNIADESRRAVVLTATYADEPATDIMFEPTPA